MAALFRTPKRSAGILSLVLAVAGVGLGVVTVVLGLGWTSWIVALIAVALAVVLVLSGTGRSLLLGVVAAAVVVAVGVLAGRIQPPPPAGWAVMPQLTSASDDSDDQDVAVGRDDRVAVSLSRTDNVVRGVAVSNGDELWTNTEANRDGYMDAVLAGDMIITFPGGSGGGGDRTTAVDVATGETVWSIESSGARPFTANDEVVVLSDGETITAVSRETGDERWRLAAHPSASSEGASGFSPNRWSAHNDWIVVQDPTDPGATNGVIEVSTGDEALTFEADTGDFAIVGDMLVTFDYNDSRAPIAIGTPISGGDGWTTEIQEWGVGGSYEPLGSALRIVGESFVQIIDAATGDSTTHELPEHWEFADLYFGIDGARALVATRLDDARTVTATGIVDALTGDLTEFEGEGAISEARADGVTPTGTLISITVRDAVGGYENKLVFVPDP